MIVFLAIALSAAEILPYGSFEAACQKASDSGLDTIYAAESVVGATSIRMCCETKYSNNYGYQDLCKDFPADFECSGKSPAVVIKKFRCSARPTWTISEIK